MIRYRIRYLPKGEMGASRWMVEELSWRLLWTVKTKRKALRDVKRSRKAEKIRRGR